MLALKPLPDLEKTVIEIAVELLLADQEHRFPDLLYAHHDQNMSVRITAHYVLALLAYGFTPSEPEIDKALGWFNTDFPKYQGEDDTVDTLEMNRLDVLLRLRPQSEGVRARLKQLIGQRDSQDEFFDVQFGWDGFDTLWALEMLARAHHAGVMPDGLTQGQIESWLHSLIVKGELRRDKDRALALRLYYDLCGGLHEAHLPILSAILDRPEASGGLWGMREFSWQIKSLRWYQDLVQQRPLTYDDVEGQSERFRKVILSTCMVVEALAPLATDYPQVKEPLERAMALWWRQFGGSSAVAMLRGLFSRANDYDYLLVLARTLRAVRAYVGHPLRELNTLHLLRELTRLKTDTGDSSEILSIKQALRSWLQFDLAEPPERLRLGYSDANVVRVRPLIWSPMANPDERPASLIQDTLIIKYGPTDEINKERQNYEQLDAAIRDYFVRIPEASYTDTDNGLAYVIMQDLRDYKTLYEVREQAAQHHSEVGDKLANFLLRMHEGGSTRINPAPRSLFRELYLGKFLEHVDRVFEFLAEHAPAERRPALRTTQDQMFEMIAQILHHQRRLEGFSQSYMHGDLHLRNIMVAGLRGETRHEPNLRGMVFKLIDLEFMRADGDAAFDAGQLVTDVSLIAPTLRHHGQGLLRLASTLERAYSEFAERRSDAMFGVRLELAKARALMRIAKGRAKRGQRYHAADNQHLLGQLCGQVIENVDAASTALQVVVSAMQG
jgi:hypothetical protein